jgi:cytidylate kinase
VIRIITIEREFACGAQPIAEKLAARLNWKLWDQQLTQEIAKLANCNQSEVEQREERRDPLYRRLLKSFALGSYEGNLGVYPIESLDKQHHAEALVDTVDRERAAFIKNYFQVDWPNLAVYHAMINTQSGDEQVIAAMLSFFEHAARENVG